MEAMEIEGMEMALEESESEGTEVMLLGKDAVEVGAKLFALAVAAVDVSSADE